MIAAAYVRVSDKRQDEYSPESQLKLIRDYAARNGLDLPAEYVFFDDGISAKSSAKRDAFREMIALAKEKHPPFSAILVWKFSRFARNQEESIVYKSMLKRNGVSVISVSEPIPEDAFGSLIERIIEWMDEYYLIRLAPEVRRGMAEKASRGESMAAAAFGYTFNKTTKLYEPDPATAPALRSVFERYAAGDGMRQIAADLNAAGYRTTRGNPIENRTVEYMLNNPVYIGMIRWCPSGRRASARDYAPEQYIITPGKHKPLIDKPLWDAVQQRLAAEKLKYAPHQRRDQSVEWMLKGLVRCSACGATLTYQQFACPSMQCYNYAKGRCTVSHSLSINKANRLVIDALRELVDNAAIPLAPEIRSAAPIVIDYEKQLADLARRRTRLQDAYLDGAFPLPDFKRRLSQLDDEEEKIQKQKEAAASAAPFDSAAYRQQLRSVLSIIESPASSEAVKASALRSVISSITYQKPSGTLDIHFYA